MFGWLIPTILGALAQNITNKQTAKANAGANAGSVANASTAWNNAFRRMAPWLAPGAGPLGHMSVTPVGAPNYGTPYGSPSAGPTTMGGGANSGIMNSIIQGILAKIAPQAAGQQSSVAPSGAANPAFRPNPNMPTTMNYGNLGLQQPTSPQTSFGTAGGTGAPNISSMIARYLGGGAGGMSPGGQGAQANFGGGVRAYA